MANWFETRKSREEPTKLTDEGRWALKNVIEPEFVERDGRRVMTAKSFRVVSEAHETLGEHGEGMVV